MQVPKPPGISRSASSQNPSVDVKPDKVWMEFDDLLIQSESRRDAQWEKDFLSQFATQNIVIESKETRLGPDHWPYLLGRSGNEATEPVWQVMHWLSNKGVGFALNTHKAMPDYVFTYGMVWHFRETGLFQLDVSRQDSRSVTFNLGQEIVSGPPSIEYIPPYVRDILKQFFSHQDIKEGPRWLMVNADGEHYDLCFSLESLGCPKKEEHRGIAESLSWFFPNHFSIVLISEKYFPKFYDLDDGCEIKSHS